MPLVTIRFIFDQPFIFVWISGGPAETATLCGFQSAVTIGSYVLFDYIGSGVALSNFPRLCGCC